jgi:hypothetical protein
LPEIGSLKSTLPTLSLRKQRTEENSHMSTLGLKDYQHGSDVIPLTEIREERSRTKERWFYKTDEKNVWCPEIEVLSIGSGASDEKIHGRQQV